MRTNGTTAAGPERFRLYNRQRKLRIDRGRLGRYLGLLTGLLPTPPVSVGIALVSDRRIAALNRRHLGKSRPTDILSFKTNPDAGELVISAQTALVNAASYRHSLEEELAYLVIHGVLHLRGERDYTAAEFRRMKRRQDALFRRMAAGARRLRATP